MWHVIDLKRCIGVKLQIIKCFMYDGLQRLRRKTTIRAAFAHPLGEIYENTTYLRTTEYMSVIKMSGFRGVDKASFQI